MTIHGSQGRQELVGPLLIEPYRPPHRRDRTQVSDEGAHLVAFLAKDADSCDVRLATPMRG